APKVGGDVVSDWNGTDWTQVPGSQLPATSGLFVTTVFDTLRGRSILLGERQCPTCPANDDTWEWDGTAWTGPMSGTPERLGAAMVYDAAQGAAVLFGGNDLSNLSLSETWVYRGDVLLGDIDANCEVDAADAAILVHALLGDTLPPAQLARADVNQDGAVD